MSTLIQTKLSTLKPFQSVESMMFSLSSALLLAKFVMAIKPKSWQQSGWVEAELQQAKQESLVQVVKGHRQATLGQ